MAVRRSSDADMQMSSGISMTGRTRQYKTGFIGRLRYSDNCPVAAGSARLT
jgi:hypothetical protein